MSEKSNAVCVSEKVVTLKGVQLIALTGKAGAGKSSAAAFLVEKHGFHRMRFAAILKQMLMVMGLTVEDVDGWRKNTPNELLLGKTPREAMQTLGTEWGRDRIHPDIWVHLWQRQALQRMAQGYSIVVDDMRFPNEYDYFKQIGGKVLKVEAPTETLMDNKVAALHVSELHELPYDRVIWNAKNGFEQLHGAVEEALWSLNHSAN